MVYNWFYIHWFHLLINAWCSFYIAGPQPAAGTKLSLITRLGYTDGDDPNPTLMAAKIQDRQISCHLRKKHKFGGSTYDCSPMPLVVLYSLYHDHYIINIKVPDREGPHSKKFKINQGFDHIEDLYVSVSFTRIKLNCMFRCCDVQKLH